MVEQVGLPKIIPDEFVENVPFLSNLAWSPEEVVLILMEEFYISCSFREMLTVRKGTGYSLGAYLYRLGRTLAEFITRKLELKSVNNSWRVNESNSP